MANENSDAFMLLQGQILGLQCSLGALIGSLAMNVPDLGEALLQGRDASSHLVEVLATKASNIASRELIGTALEVVETLWEPVRRPD